MIIGQRAPRPASRRLFCRGVAWWHSQAHHIGEGAGIVISDVSDQARDLAGEDRLAGHDLEQRRQRSFMISSRYSIKNEPVAQSARESHSHSSPWNCLCILLGIYRIVEGPVEVTERYVDSHPGNREFGLAGIGHTR